VVLQRVLDNVSSLFRVLLHHQPEECKKTIKT
jgi:hypothetical protein